MDWLTKNIRYITIIVVVLLLFKSGQSCSRKMSLKTTKKVMTKECDSLINNVETYVIELHKENDSLEKIIIIRDFEIKDLINELKIAGVKVNAAQRRADAVQKTAEAIKTNTTIEVRGVEKIKDTLNNEL